MRNRSRTKMDFTSSFSSHFKLTISPMFRLLLYTARNPKQNLPIFRIFIKQLFFAKDNAINSLLLQNSQNLCMKLFLGGSGKQKHNCFSPTNITLPNALLLSFYKFVVAGHSYDFRWREDEDTS